MKQSTKELQESHENAKICYICKEKFENNYVKHKKIVKSKIMAIMQGNIEVLHVAYVT